MEKENEKPTEQTMQTLLEYQEIFQVALKSAGICVFKVDLNRQLYIFLENAQAVFGKPDKEILSEINRFRDFPPAAYQQEIAKYFSHPTTRSPQSAPFRPSGPESRSPITPE